MSIQDVVNDGNDIKSFATFVCIAHYCVKRLKDTVELFDRIIEVLPKLLPEIFSALKSTDVEDPSKHTETVTVTYILLYTYLMVILWY